MGSCRVAVYRLFCPNGNLVYIGRSATPEARIKVHRRCNYGWQSDLGEATIEWFPNAGAARRAARAATIVERPENVDPTLDLTADPTCVVYLYRMYGKDDELLYIGITKDIYARFENHRFAIPWERYTTEEYPDRASAALAEGRAILAENPKLNVIRGKNGPARERRPLTRSLYEARVQLRTRLEAGEVTAREALDALVQFPRVSPWKAANMLGLENGGYSGVRTYRTVDKLLELNGLR